MKRQVLYILMFFVLASLCYAITPTNFEVYELGDDGFVVGWQTNELVTSQVLYGTSGRLGEESSQSNQFTTDHVVQVDGLNDDTVYFFRASGQNAQGEEYFSVIGVTRTTPSTDTSPPVVDPIDPSFYIGRASNGAKDASIAGAISINNYPSSTIIYETDLQPDYVEFEVDGEVYRENGAPWGIKANFGEWVKKDSHDIIVRLYLDEQVIETKEIRLLFQGVSLDNPTVPQPIPPIDDGKLKAFPSAYGGGSEVTGGRGGVLVKVNTLNFDAPLVHHKKSGNRDEYYTGGFKAAVERDIGPRTIVFDVSGNIIGNGERIHPKSQEGHSILGQSAPRGGITLHKTHLRYTTSDNILIRYLRSRPAIIQGDPIGDDSLTTPILVWATRVMIDHVSVSWGGDKALTAGCHRPCNLADVTVQNSFLSDSATLGKSAQASSTEDLFDGNGNITWVYNLFAGVHRTPNMGGFYGIGEIQNNVVQNKGSRMVNIVVGEPNINHVGNWYRHYTDRYVKNVINDHGDVDPNIYTSNNYYRNEDGVILRGADGEDNRVFWAHHRDYSKPLPNRMFLSESMYGEIINPAPLLTPQEAYEKAASGDVGANKYIDDDGRVQFYQDSYDKKAIENLNNDVMPYRKFSSDWKLPSLPTNRRPSSYDTDNDGMSDAWERRTFGNLDQSYRGDYDGDGYTNIEEFMNQVDYFTR